jgi:hypothetical protein
LQPDQEVPVKHRHSEKITFCSCDQKATEHQQNVTRSIREKTEKNILQPDQEVPVKHRHSEKITFCSCDQKATEHQQNVTRSIRDKTKKKYIAA